MPVGLCRWPPDCDRCKLGPGTTPPVLLPKDLRAGGERATVLGGDHEAFPSSHPGDQPLPDFQPVTGTEIY